MRRLSEGAYRLRGEGAFRVLARAKELERQGRSILHFEIGEPDAETPAHIAERGIEAIRRGQTHYCQALGLPALREAVQQEVARTRGFRPEPEQVLILPGVKPGIFLAMLAVLDPGDEVLFQDPSFPTYASVAAFLGARPVPVPLREEKEFRLQPADVKGRLTSRSKLLIVNSPHNPTGAVLDPGEVAELAALAEEHDLFLMTDEIYSRMLYEGVHASPAARDGARERTILLDGFSKSYAMTGWRLGWLVAPAPLVAVLENFAINAVSCTAPFVQLAGAAALEGPQEFVPAMMDRFREKRDRIVAGLDSVRGFSCRPPRGAFYAWVNIRGTGMTAQACADLLLEKAGVAALPGTAFGAAGEGYLRFSYANTLENIDAAVGRLREVLGA